MNLPNFLNDESGAITVDWVVLTSAIVGIAIAVLLIIAGGINSSANSSTGQIASTSSISDLIGDTGYGNLNDDYTKDSRPDAHPTTHEHYTNTETQEKFYYNTVNGDLSAGETGSGGVVATVDESGNITEL